MPATANLAGRSIDRRELIKRAQSELAAIDSDLDALPSANTTQTKQVIGRLLQRQRVIIRALAAEVLE